MTHDADEADRTAATLSHSPLLAGLNFRLWYEAESTHAAVTLGPAGYATGTQRTRPGVLLLLADIVGGMRHDGPLTPTVDINLQVLAPPAPGTTLRVVCHPTKMGRRLFVGEVLMHAGDAVVARAVLTFVNKVYAGPWPSAPAEPPDFSSLPPLEERLDARYPDDRTVLVERRPGITNGSQGSIQGGVQAIVAELACERVLAAGGDGDMAVTDLDIRYLRPVLHGPLAATADVIGRAADRAYVRVGLADRGGDARPIGVVTAVCRRT